MRTHVALLRGINVGGNNKLAMTELREIAAALGHTEVATYIQSGNLVFATAQSDTAALAEALADSIAARTGLRIDVVVLSRAQLAQVIADNPFPQESDPKCLHAVLRNRDLTAEASAAVDAARSKAAEKGSADEAVVVGRTLYLRTPDGLGRSDLAARLTRPPAAAKPGRERQEGGTARNWATVTKLMAMLDESA